MTEELCFTCNWHGTNACKDCKIACVDGTVVATQTHYKSKDEEREHLENKLLRYWQHVFALDDWTIKLKTNCEPDEMAVENSCGCVDYTESCKTARIEIIDPKFYGDRITPFNFEKTLIHELLHLKFCLFDLGGETVTDRLMHQIIEDLARAFTAKQAERRKIFNEMADLERVVPEWMEDGDGLG